MANGDVNVSVACTWCGEAQPTVAPEVPDGNGCLHFAEGTVLAVMAAAAGTYYADDRGWPWLTAVGAVVAVLVFAATIAVVRSENREARWARGVAEHVADHVTGIRAGAPRRCVNCGDDFTPEEPDGPAAT